MSEKSNDFASVLRIVPLVNANDQQVGDGSRDQEAPGQVISKMRVTGDGKFARLEASGDQPRPPIVEFDQVCSPGDPSYQKLTAELVENTLLGFHGTIISLGLEASHRRGFLADPSQGAVIRAAWQILKCLKRTVRSRFVANLVVLCSYILVADEAVHDLLDTGADRGSTITEKRGLGVLKDGKELTITVIQANAKSDVARMLTEGTEVGSQIVGREQVSYHTVFIIRVEYSQFGSMAAPVSGTLSLVDLGAIDILYQQTGETQGELETSSRSLSSFAATVNALTCPPSERQALPIPERTMLSKILKEALGGNCKTLLLCDVPEQITSARLAICMEAMKLASRARKIENKPDRTELARKALMDAYMKELRKLHGSARLLRQPPSSSKEGIEIAANALAIAAKGSHSTSIEDSESSDEEVDNDQEDNMDFMPDGRSAIMIIMLGQV